MPSRASNNAFAFLAFPLAILFVFTLLPTIFGLALSVFAWDGGAAPGSLRFVGLANYRALASDPRFGHALINTLIYVIASVPVTVFLAFLLALAVHARWFRGRAFVRTVLFMPTVVSIVAIGFVWRWLLDDQAGLISGACRALGLDPPNWLQDGAWPMAMIILVSVWRALGFNLVLYLAALGAVSESLVEAAELDGAPRTAIARHVTWPQVAPTTAFLMITGVIGALQVFDIVYVMTGQSESDATNVLNLYIYRQFTYGQLGYAAAIGVVIFVLTLAATLIQLWYLQFRSRVPAARVVTKGRLPR